MGWETFRAIFRPMGDFKTSSQPAWWAKNVVEKFANFFTTS
jgi:hypothetical protein